MRKVLLALTIMLLSAAGATAQNYIHIVQIDSTTTVNLEEVREIYFTLDDYEPSYVGIYKSWFFGTTEEVTLEYSPSKELYRFKDCWMPGYHVTFILYPETMKFWMTANSFISGYVHSKYGMVTAEVYQSGAYNYFDPETMTFYFAYKWTVSAGSLGAGYDTFQVTGYGGSSKSKALDVKTTDKKPVLKLPTQQPRAEKPVKNDNIMTIKKATDDCITE